MCVYITVCSGHSVFLIKMLLARNSNAKVRKTKEIEVFLTSPVTI